MDPSIFDGDCRPALTIDDRFPALTPEWESVNDICNDGTDEKNYRGPLRAFIGGNL